MSAITLEDCQKILKRCNNGEKNFQIKVDDKEMSPVSETPMGFLGDHQLLTITYCGTSEIQKKRQFFVKSLPKNNQTHINYITAMGIFKKESIIYQNLLSEFNTNQKRAVAATCYYTTTDSVLVLEDLSLKGYKVPKDEELNENHWKSVMRTMALLHSSSIIYEEQRSMPDKTYRIDKELPQAVFEVTFSKDVRHPRYQWARNTSKCVADAMRFLDFQINPSLGEEFIRFATEDIFKFIEPSEKWRNVLSHADLWKNNIMFDEKFNSVFVDFQLARYAPPALDLLTALHVNCSAAFLSVYLPELLLIYYETFAQSLESHKINCESILSWSDFLRSLQYFKMAALTESALFATIVFVGEELTDSIVNNENTFKEFTFENRSKFVEKEIANNVRCKEKLKDIVARLIECF